MNNQPNRRQLRVVSPLAQRALTHQLLHAAMAQGDVHEDYAAIIEAVERSAGLPTELSTAME